MIRLTLVVLDDKNNCILRHEFHKKFSKSQFNENADESLIYM